MAVTVTDGTFSDEVLHSELPALVDFWADWCAPCRALAPVLEELAVAWSGRLKVCKVDADKNPASVDRCAVMGLPTLVLFRDGRVLGRTSQARTRRDVDAFLAGHL